jgi:electron-transferring-flavoprotein dehydrogenase
MENVPVDVSLEVFGAPETRFCPAKVYEFVLDDKTNSQKLQINA